MPIPKVLTRDQVRVAVVATKDDAERQDGDVGVRTVKVAKPWRDQTAKPEK